MYPKGEADGKRVNIPVLVYIAMGRRRCVRAANGRNSWLKYEGDDCVGKSAQELKYDSTQRLRLAR